MMMNWLYDDVITWDLSSIPPLTIICSKTMIFFVFYESVTNGPTDRPTDRPSYRDARTHLKRRKRRRKRKRKFYKTRLRRKRIQSGFRWEKSLEMHFWGKGVKLMFYDWNFSNITRTATSNNLQSHLQINLNRHLHRQFQQPSPPPPD